MKRTCKGLLRSSLPGPCLDSEFWIVLKLATLIIIVLLILNSVVIEHRGWNNDPFRQIPNRLRNDKQWLSRQPSAFPRWTT